MVDGIESRTEVEDDEDDEEGEAARVRGEEEVVGDFEEGCFCAVL